MAEAIDELRCGLGLPSDPRCERVLGGPYLSLSPPLLDDLSAWPTGDVRRYRDPAEGAPPAPPPDGWGNPDAPLVYVTFGTVAAGSGYFPDLYRGVLEALEDVDARVLMTVGRAHDPEDLGPLPENARVERWIPQAELLPHCAAMVCHGGSGTVRQGLSAGVPLVVLPLFADQPENARLVHRMGPASRWSWTARRGPRSTTRWPAWTRCRRRCGRSCRRPRTTRPPGASRRRPRSCRRSTTSCRCCTGSPVRAATSRPRRRASGRRGGGAAAGRPEPPPRTDLRVPDDAVAARVGAVVDHHVEPLAARRDLDLAAERRRPCRATAT